MSITEFAGGCRVSESMLVRFTEKNGLAGYGELKVKLRLEEREIEEALGPEEELLNTVTNSYHKIVDELIGRGPDSLFEKLYRAQQVFLYGSGSARTRAISEIERISLPVKEVSHIHRHGMRDALSRVMTERDMAVIILLTGESKAAVSLTRELRLRQVPAPSITRLGNNTLASVCDENLYIHSTTLPARHEVEYKISTPYFILIGCLYLTYQEFLKHQLDSL